MATLAGHGWRRCRFSPDFRHEVENVETVARFSRLLRRERAGEATCSRHARDKEATRARRIWDKPRRRRGNAATIPPGEATGTPRVCHPVDKSIKERPLHAAQRCLRYFPTLEVPVGFRSIVGRSRARQASFLADVQRRSIVTHANARQRCQIRPAATAMPRHHHAKVRSPPTVGPANAMGRTVSISAF